MDEFKEFYPDFRDSVDSTAAASVNGYIGGFGDTDSLSRKTKDFGLSDDGAKHLQNMGGFLDTTLPAALDKGLAVIAMKVLGASHYLSSKTGITPELLIKYALSQDISLAIVGCSTPQEVITLAQVGRTFSPLSPKETEGNRRVLSTQCSKIGLLPQLVKITFLYLNKGCKTEDLRNCTS